MTKKHAHCDVIKAWADGAEIQWSNSASMVWYDCGEDNPPEWHIDIEYRVKPTPKPNTIIFCEVERDDDIIQTSYCSFRKEALHNLKLIFDGDTGNLKEAVVLD